MGPGAFEKNHIFQKKYEIFIFCPDFRENIISKHNFRVFDRFPGSKNDSEHSNSLKSDLIDPNIGN